MFYDVMAMSACPHVLGVPERRYHDDDYDSYDRHDRHNEHDRDIHAGAR